MNVDQTLEGFKFDKVQLKVHSLGFEKSEKIFFYIRPIFCDPTLETLLHVP